MDKISQNQDHPVPEKVRFIVGIGPQLGVSLTVRELMFGVLLALVPALAFSIYLFGPAALNLYLVCGGTALAAEFAGQRLLGKPVRIGDGSALLTGILLAMCLPPAFPLWMAGLGAAFAIAAGKLIFGGLGSNIFNPALIGRAFLSATFPNQMTAWVAPFYYQKAAATAVTSATPLGAAKFSHVYASYHDLFFGFTGGSLGETSAFLLLLGGLFILARGYADWRPTAAYLLSTFVLSACFNLAAPDRFPPPLFHLLSGRLVLGAFFMVTDPVTTPVHRKGRWIFGIGCGVFTVIIRLFGGMPEGVAYSILFMNALSPLINLGTRPRPFGSQGAQK